MPGGKSHTGQWISLQTHRPAWNEILPALQPLDTFLKVFSRAVLPPPMYRRLRPLPHHCIVVILLARSSPAPRRARRAIPQDGKPWLDCDNPEAALQFVPGRDRGQMCSKEPPSSTDSSNDGVVGPARHCTQTSQLFCDKLRIQNRDR